MQDMLQSTACLTEGFQQSPNVAILYCHRLFAYHDAVQPHIYYQRRGLPRLAEQLAYKMDLSAAGAAERPQQAQSPHSLELFLAELSSQKVLWRHWHSPCPAFRLQSVGQQADVSLYVTLIWLRYSEIPFRR